MEEHEYFISNNIPQQPVIENVDDVDIVPYKKVLRKQSTLHKSFGSFKGDEDQERSRSRAKSLNERSFYDEISKSGVNTLNQNLVFDHKLNEKM